MLSNERQKSYHGHDLQNWILYSNSFRIQTQQVEEANFRGSFETEASIVWKCTNMTGWKFSGRGDTCQGESLVCLYASTIHHKFLGSSIVTKCTLWIKSSVGRLMHSNAALRLLSESTDSMISDLSTQYQVSLKGTSTGIISSSTAHWRHAASL